MNTINKNRLSRFALVLALSVGAQSAFAEEGGLDIRKLISDAQKVVSNAVTLSGLAASVAEDIGDANTKIGMFAHNVYADISAGTITNGSILDISNVNIKDSTVGAMLINTLVSANGLVVDDGAIYIADIDIVKSFLGVAIINTAVIATDTRVDGGSTVRIGTTNIN